MTGLDEQLDLGRMRDLQGRGSHPWIRRALLAVLGIPLLPALTGAIGQSTRSLVAGGAGARLRVEVPDVLRGGLMWRARIAVRATRTIRHRRIILGPGFLEGMQVNTIEPSPQSEASRGPHVVTGDLVQQGVTQSDYSLTGAMTVIATIALLTVALSYLSLKVPRLRPLLDGEPLVLVQDGKVIQRNLRRARITIDEVLAAGVACARALRRPRDQRRDLLHPLRRLSPPVAAALPGAPDQALELVDTKPVTPG